jgi:hypothetical protein
LIKLNPHFLEVLTLNPDLVMKGEVWRLFTYIFIPIIGGLFPDWLGAAFYILYFIWIGTGLEEAIGAFRTTLFYLLGMVGTTIAAFLTGGNTSAFLLNTSLLFAFARFYGDNTIYLFLVLPLKVKWMAWFTGALVLLGFLVGTWSYRGAVIAALSNFLLFFGREIAHEAKHRQEVSGRRRRFEEAAQSADESMHRCTVCGRTELVAPDLEFRVARDGEEYCLEHLPKAAPAPPPIQG